jgi:hypothetical protein
MKGYGSAMKWASDDTVSKSEIFKEVSKVSDIDTLCGILDGIILRRDDLVKGFMKQNSSRLNDSVILVSAEHAALSGNEGKLKMLSQFISKKVEGVNESLKFVSGLDPKAGEMFRKYLKCD